MHGKANGMGETRAVKKKMLCVLERSTAPTSRRILKTKTALVGVKK
jgi:hypothetical protein